ncbi:CG15554 [Drosophila busckii]|uniref:CG15554 n=1 Tax=Drosophila busckii TaxID=30019 RepID=A0A0M4EWR0_DROBS|nr:CG15554 [Drosophila busckii]
MYRTCLCLLIVFSVVSAASYAYLPRLTRAQSPLQNQLHQQPPPQQPQQQHQPLPYHYYMPNSGAMLALRKIIQGHLQRFQQQDTALLLQVRRPTLLPQPNRVAVQPQLQRQLVTSAATNHLEGVVPPNTPTPKNYAMNFLPEGRDVVPGTSYIPLRLLIRR